MASESVTLEAIAGKLVSCLQSLDPAGKSSARQLLHQLAHGSKDEKTLADIMNDLGRAKSNLSLHLQVANVGLTRSVENTIVADAEVIRRIDRLLQQVFGEGRGLQIAELLKDRPRDGMSNHLLSENADEA